MTAGKAWSQLPGVAKGALALATTVIVTVGGLGAWYNLPTRTDRLEAQMVDVQQTTRQFETRLHAYEAQTTARLDSLRSDIGYSTCLIEWLAGAEDRDLLLCGRRRTSP